MKDYIIRATAGNYQIRAFAATTKHMVETARNYHNTSPVASAALGRLMTAGAIMGSMLKGEKDLLTLQIKGNGKLKGIVVTADSKGNVKGYVYNPNVDLPLKENGKLDVSRAVGEGVLTIIRDIGLKEPYVGQIKLVSGEIAEDLTYYFANSEQIPSVVALGVLVNRDYSIKQSGGLIIQLMPDANEETISFLENKISGLTSVTNLLEEGKTPEDILEDILGELGLEIHEKKETQFYCNCSKERVEKALISIGKKDLQEMIDDNEPIELNCHFCNEKYIFTIEELKSLIQKI